MVSPHTFHHLSRSAPDHAGSTALACTPHTLTRAQSQWRPAPLSLLIASLSMGMISPALALTQLPTVKVEHQEHPRTAGNAPDLGLEARTETATRTGLSHLLTPASVSSLSSPQLQERGDYQLREGITRAVGIIDVGSGGTGGLSFSSRGYSGTNSVGIAEDGVRIETGAGTQNYPGSSWGYERIEVLHGPASVVYGSGTVGASVNAVRKQPQRTAAQEMLLSLGNDRLRRLALGSTGALGEHSSYRLDAYGSWTQGERELGQAREGKLMSQLRFAPHADWRFDLIADYSVHHPERYWGTPHDQGRILEALRHNNYNAADAVIRYADTRLRARAHWQIDAQWRLSNELYQLDSQRRWMNIENYRLDLANQQVLRSDYLHIQHDLTQTGNRLQANWQGGAHRLALGWDVTQVDFRHTNNSPYGGSSVVDLWRPLAGQWYSPDPTLPGYDSHSRLQALHVEDAWQLSEDWLLLAGLRRDLARIKRHDMCRPAASLEQHLAGNAWRLGLTHVLDGAGNQSLYTQFSKGHDPVSSLISLNLANAAFKLTRGRQLEIGYKQLLPQHHAQWTAAIYRIEKSDIITRDPLRPSLSIQGGRQHSQGLELTAAIRPWQDWRLEGNITWLQARYDELEERQGSGSVSRAGKRPGDVPQRVANLWLHHAMAAWQGSLGLRHVSARYTSSANTLELPAYTVFDGALSWQLDARTTLRLLGRNLGDRLYATRSTNSQLTLAEGRRFELVAELSF